MGQFYDVNYIHVDGDLIFFSPDGIGRIFFPSVEEAKSETGLTKVITQVYLDDKDSH